MQGAGPRGILSEDFPAEVVGLAEAFCLQQEKGATGARDTTALWVSKEGISAEKAAKRWIDANEDIVEGWIEAAKG